MASLILSRRDVDFLLYEWLVIERLVTRQKFVEHSRETLDAALDAYQKIAAEEFAPHNKLADRQPPRLEGEAVRVLPEQRHAFATFADAGLLAACHDASLGGMGLPYVVERAGMAFVMAANISTAAYAFLTIANANLILAYGSRQQISRFIPALLAGRSAGTMCLSEPQAGSSLADITTRAVQQPDGTYRLFGNKMWISGGDHDLTDNITHLVLARVPDGSIAARPSGGISLFLVPKFVVGPDGAVGERNDVVVAGLNHKMGYRGTSNCLLNFGEGRYMPLGRSGAVGERVGEEGRGLACMFHMMNEARISVGLGAAALGCTAFLHALDYASNRRQGRLPMERDPTRPPARLVEHTDVRRMLLAQKALSEGALALALYCASLVDEEASGPVADRPAVHALLELLTPIAKSWPSKWALAANDLAIQVHGGYGYTQDFNVEQFYRDNRLNPIHEGTHGIQAIDLLGRKVGSAGGAAMASLGERLEISVERATRIHELAEAASVLRAAWRRLVTVTNGLLARPDPVERLANASCYLDTFGHVVVAWLWLDQALVATAKQSSGDNGFYRGKAMACQYFFRWELPRTDRWLALLEPVERTPLDMREDWFA